MSPRAVLAVWFGCIAAFCFALTLFGVSARVALGVFIIVAALRAAGEVSVKSRRGGSGE